MSTAFKDIAAACAAIAAVEVVCRLCRDSKMIGFIKSLAVMAVVISATAQLFSLDFDISQPAYLAEQTGSALSEYITQETQKAAEVEFTDYISGLLATINLQAEKITVGTDITDDNSIVLTKLIVEFAYESDAQLAQALLNGTLNDGVEVTVKTNGH